MSTALTHSSQQDYEAEADDGVDVSAAAVYDGNSSGIIASFEGLLEKAVVQLATTRKTEASILHNYEE